ncbi:hypothetical protein [Pseudomonas paracarnis]|jgi:hypothetical protein|uniref:hypothetical protein n=1 Tax=Pseudomonas paracarnis TaxID=2750625 RepID=UPI001C6F6DBB|nr:hypothetical protein [Pseudomonas paracarnis]MBW9242085.1 hypothetical protein [Pseudomonas paracarnis]
MITKAGRDPRTIARNIPGILNAIFPGLTPGIVSFYNKLAIDCAVIVVPAEAIQASELQKSLLFELAFAVGEQRVLGNNPTWGECVATATDRQSRFFDAISPSEISENDQRIALRVADNLVTMVKQVATDCNSAYGAAPVIPGFRWIASGTGDFFAGSTLIEVKCIAGNFSAADYRQVAMYWLLSYAAAVETGNYEWRSCVLMNPRTGKLVNIHFDEFIQLTGGGRSKVEILQAFAATLTDIQKF